MLLTAENPDMCGSKSSRITPRTGGACNKTNRPGDSSKNGGDDDKKKGRGSGAGETDRLQVKDLTAQLLDFAGAELENNLLPFWTTRMTDKVNGGFIGAVTQEGDPLPGAPKGLILNSRLLWTFSAVYNHDRRFDYRCLAQRAWDYITTRFADTVYGGYFWTVDEAGNPLEKKKQTYAQAFVVYAFSEFYRACGSQEVLDAAICQYRLIEEKCADSVHGGYLEAFSQSWEEIADSRLSEKDLNESKTMNTHLHVLEAYTSLLGVWDDPGLRERLKMLTGIFAGKIVGDGILHQKLFFNEKWEPRSPLISYGHDIEASWLLCEAARTVGGRELAERTAELSLRLARGAAEGVNRLGGLTHESDGKGSTDGEMEWWAQAEAVVGFVNAWRLSGDGHYLELASGVKEFIEKFVIDREGGEWFYRLNAEGRPLAGFDKAGFWKCPYHNVRMCLEITRLV